MRLDVAVVGFLIFTILGPFVGGYLGAWLVDGAGSRAIVAFLAGGSGTQALAAAVGSAVALALTLRFAAGSVLDAFVSGWPEGEPLVTDPRWRLLRLSSRFADGGDEIDEESPLGLGGAIGWVGAVVGGTLLAGMALAGWPAVDTGVIGRVGAGTGTTLDWVSAAFPAVARTLIAAVVGTLAGAVWSVMTSPVANESP
jgi:hypothetical protein